MLLVNVMENHTLVEAAVVDLITRLFQTDRVCCLLRYGPSKAIANSLPNDFDFLLLLDTYNLDDYAKMLEIKKSHLPIEIFFEYKDHISLRGLSNYKRGCHGAYFVYILSTATTLLGENFYLKNLPEVSLSVAKNDLLERIEEYFYRIQKLLLCNQDQEIPQSVLKYFARIISDLLLYSDELSFRDMHEYHYTDIIDSVLNKTSLFESSDVLKIQSMFSSRTLYIAEIVVIVEILNSVYEGLLRKRNEKSI